MNLSNQIDKDAYHESGHAVACYYLKRKFEFVTVESRESCFLKTSPSPSIAFFCEQLNPKKKLELDKNMIFKESVMRLAGMVSESIYMKEFKWIENEQSCTAILLQYFNDELNGIEKEIIDGGYDDIENILVSIKEYPIHPIEFLAIMLINTKNLIANLWDGVEALSKQLVEKHTIQERDAIKIIQSAIEE